jgi:hypothetical protein
LALTSQWFGGQVVDIEEADYIIVDRAFAHQIPPLKGKQHIIDSVWIDNSLELGQAQKIIIPGDIPNPSSGDNKPEVALGPSTPSQDQSLTKGRKRSATLSAPGPVAKIKRPGTSKATQASLTSTIRAPASVANHQDEATPVAYSLSGLFQIASEDDTPAQKESRNYYIAQVVNELDEWCHKEFEGTRTAFLESKRREVDVSPTGYQWALLMIQREFDRVAFFSYNKKAILKGLSRKGRDIGLGSELYEGARRSGKANAVESSSSVASRPIQSGSSALRAPAASATPKSSHRSIPLPIRIAPAPVGQDPFARRQSVNASTAQKMKLPSSDDFSALARNRRAVTPGSTYLEEKRERQLAIIIDELNQWCLNGSEGSRSAHLAKMTEANVSALHDPHSSALMTS